MIHRRHFLRAAGVAGTAIGVAGWTRGVELHWIEIVERVLPIAALPPALAGARLVQLSDLHIGPVVSDDYLRETFARVVALRPDIVVVTGDFLTHRGDRGEAQYAQLAELLADLPRGRLATLGILGNHDYGWQWSDPDVARRVQAVAERAGIRILRNEAATVAGLDVIGVDDHWARRADPLHALAQRTHDAALVLCHNPDTLDQRPWGDWRGWILSGHTHGGQCKPPFMDPPLLPVANRRYAAGEVRLADGRTLYVNRGVGHTLPVRFNVRPEVTVHILRAA